MFTYIVSFLDTPQQAFTDQPDDKKAVQWLTNFLSDSPCRGALRYAGWKITAHDQTTKETYSYGLKEIL